MVASPIKIPPPPPVAAGNPRGRFGLANVNTVAAAAPTMSGAIPPPPPPLPPAAQQSLQSHAVPPPPLTTALLRSALAASPQKGGGPSPAVDKENADSPAFLSAMVARCKTSNNDAASPSVASPSPQKRSAGRGAAASPYQSRSRSRGDSAEQYSPYSRAKFFGKYLYLKSFRVRPQTPTSEEKRLRQMMGPAHRRGLCISPNALKEQLKVRSKVAQQHIQRASPAKSAASRSPSTLPSVRRALEATTPQSRDKRFPYNANDRTEAIDVNSEEDDSGALEGCSPLPNAETATATPPSSHEASTRENGNGLEEEAQFLAEAEPAAPAAVISSSCHSPIRASSVDGDYDDLDGGSDSSGVVRSLLGDITAASLSPGVSAKRDRSQSDAMAPRQRVAAAVTGPSAAPRRTLIDIIREAAEADEKRLAAPSATVDTNTNNNSTGCADDRGAHDDDTAGLNDSGAVLELEINDDDFIVVGADDDGEEEEGGADDAARPATPEAQKRAPSPKKLVATPPQRAAAPAPRSPPESRVVNGEGAPAGGGLRPYNYRRAAYLSVSSVAPAAAAVAVTAAAAPFAVAATSGSGYDSGEDELAAAINRRAEKHFAAWRRLSAHYLAEHHFILTQAMITPFARLEPMPSWEDSRKLRFGRRCMLQEVMDKRAADEMRLFLHHATHVSTQAWMFALYLTARIEAFEAHLRFLDEVREGAAFAQLRETFTAGLQRLRMLPISGGCRPLAAHSLPPPSAPTAPLSGVSNGRRGSASTGKAAPDSEFSAF